MTLRSFTISPPASHHSPAHAEAQDHKDADESENEGSRHPVRGEQVGGEGQDGGRQADIRPALSSHRKAALVVLSSSVVRGGAPEFGWIGIVLFFRISYREAFQKLKGATDVYLRVEKPSGDGFLVHSLTVDHHPAGVPGGGFEFPGHGVA